MSVYCKENPEFLDMSIKSMLEQTAISNDFVIVCDGPLTKELDAVIEKYRNKYFEIMNIIRLEENSGLGKALSIGMGYCKNEIIARMDSDDFAIPDRCRKQLDIISQKGIDIVSGIVQEFREELEDSPTLRVVPENHEDISKFAKKRNPFNHPAVMFKKEAVSKAGGYQSFYLLEDYFLWIRMLQNNAIAYNIQEPILHMRTGSGMYKRRGGLSYFISILKLRVYMKNTGFSTWWDIMYALIGYGFLCIIPNKLRKKIYDSTLRLKKRNLLHKA